MSIYLFNHRTGRVSMALKSKNTSENNLPEEFETTSETQEVNFDDLIGSTEAEYNDPDDKPKYYTITGKEQDYNPQWDVYKSYEMDIGDWIEGKPEVSIIEKKDKNYDALRLRIIDDTTDEVLDCYCNYPRADEKGFVTNIGKDFDFYRNAFDFIYSILKTRGDKYVLDKNGEEYNKFRKVDFMGFAKLVDSMSKVKVEITAGNEDSDYNSWMITSME